MSVTLMGLHLCLTRTGGVSPSGTFTPCSARKLRALHLNAQQLTVASSLQEVYDVMLETMEHTLGLSRAGILIVEGETLRQVAQSDQLTSGVEMPLDGKGVTLRAVKEGRSVLVPDVRECEDYVYARDLPGFEAEEEVADSLSELAVPIIASGYVFSC